MSIATKKGDQGDTSLVDGSRVSKNHHQLHAYGNVDELNSWIGLIRAEHSKSDLNEPLKRIQNECFVLGSHLATPPQPKMEINLPSTDLIQLGMLEDDILRWENDLPALRNFILPTGCPMGAKLHYARTLARHTERVIKALLENHSKESWAFSLKYFNRLSDWFFMAARYVNAKENSHEESWDLK